MPKWSLNSDMLHFGQLFGRLLQVATFDMYVDGRSNNNRPIVMAFLNNWLEMRSDAFKIMTHSRRPLPKRVESIGAWLDCMVSFFLVCIRITCDAPLKFNWGTGVNSTLEYFFSLSLFSVSFLFFHSSCTFHLLLTLSWLCGLLRDYP